MHVGSDDEDTKNKKISKQIASRITQCMLVVMTKTKNKEKMSKQMYQELLMHVNSDDEDNEQEDFQVNVYKT